MKLFVYGTLRSQYQFSWVTGNTSLEKYLGSVRLEGYRLEPGHIASHFPTIVPSENYHVDGVLWEVDDRDLIALDHYEGVPQLYTRKMIDDDTWVYVQNERWERDDRLGQDQRSADAERGLRGVR